MIDIDNPYKELTQEEVKMAAINERVKEFIVDFTKLANASVSGPPFTVEFFFKVLDGADIFKKETSITFQNSEPEQQFFVRYCVVYINDSLRRTINDLAAYNTPNNPWMKFRNEIFERRKELPISNSFKRLIIESYIDAEVYKRFYQGKIIGSPFVEDLSEWDKHFNEIASEYDETDYLRFGNSGHATTALETLQLKFAANFQK